jgi:soluble lytic murein transglycosylase-like protein
MLLCGAAFFVPHAGKGPPKSRHSGASSSHHRAAHPTAVAGDVPRVEVSAQYRLPPQAFEPLIYEAARRYQLDAALIRAVILTESAFDPFAVSTAGALGLMQLMPALAAELGVEDPFDPRENVMGGVRYLRQLLEAHDGDLALALASYNAGPGNVARYGGVPPFPETRSYIRKITRLIDNGRGELILD